MTDSDRLIRIERRQELVISTLNDILTAAEKQQSVLTEICEWLQKPPSSDLGETLKALVTSNHAIQATLIELPEVIVQRIGQAEVLHD